MSDSPTDGACSQYSGRVVSRDAAHHARSDDNDAARPSRPRFSFVLNGEASRSAAGITRSARP
jgi:hypothetical protein